MVSSKNVSTTGLSHLPAHQSQMCVEEAFDYIVCSYVCVCCLGSCIQVCVCLRCKVKSLQEAYAREYLYTKLYVEEVYILECETSNLSIKGEKLVHIISY